ILLLLQLVPNVVDKHADHPSMLIKNSSL
ncbi:hypothetical protein FOXB_16852, partial [Fusarium oxysporum f. sp. conglutinans Fo5176]